MTTLMPRFGIAESGPVLDPREVFPSGRRICLEIGCGNGDLASHVARHVPDVGVIAVDVHRPGIARLLDDIGTFGLDNLRVVEGDALVLVERLCVASIDEMWAFFPDPWPKNAQAHRRLFTTDRLERLARVIRPGGRFRVATDVDSYAVSIERRFRESELFTDVRFERADWRVETAFERTGREAGRTSTDIVVERTSRPVGP